MPSAWITTGEAPPGRGGNSVPVVDVDDTVEGLNIIALDNRRSVHRGRAGGREGVARAAPRLEDVLIDAGTIFDRGRILKQLAGRTLSAHALTHAHLDHYGSSRFVCERLSIPL
jgi:glyoxylase-like metal-dependent hydrolase (beta-lactamase superfamily II)